MTALCTHRSARSVREVHSAPIDPRQGDVRAVPGSLPDDARRTAVYDGELLVFPAIPPMRELCSLSDKLICDHFGPDPLYAHDRLDPEQHAALAAALRNEYRRHPEVRQLFLAALAHIGVDLERTYWDQLKARVVASGPGGTGLGVHRDTWGSNVYAQMNWWAPIYPITPERSLAIYPDYWSRPLANNSADWDLRDIRARRRAGKPIALVPHPTEPVDDRNELRVAIEPGDLLCFSGAHLHASVPNHTGVTRFNVDTRTVDPADVAASRGAPNVDGAAPRVALEWFRRVSDDSPLG
jgi:hypothetical protein